MTEMHFHKTPWVCFVGGFVLITIVIVLFGVNNGITQTTPSIIEQARKSIYGKPVDTVEIKSALTTLDSLNSQEVVAEEAKASAKYYYLDYLITMGVLKLQFGKLESTPWDTSLKYKIKSGLRRLWLDITQIEDYGESPDSNRSLNEVLKEILEEGLYVIIESARSLDHPNSLAPLAKNMLNRAGKEKYDFMKTEEELFVNYFEVVNVLLGLDYPNMTFLSNASRAEILRKEVYRLGAQIGFMEAYIDSIEKERRMAGWERKIRLRVAKEKLDSLQKELSEERRRERAFSFSVAASEVTTDYYAKCIGNYIAAWSKEKADPETATVYYNMALAEFNNFKDSTTGYLGKNFEKSQIRQDFIDKFIINLYGPNLLEEGNIQRYTTLLLNGWKIEGLSEEEKFSLAIRLSVALREAIRELESKGQNALADEYRRKLQAIDAYVSAQRNL